MFENGLASKNGGYIRNSIVYRREDINIKICITKGLKKAIHNRGRSVVK